MKNHSSRVRLTAGRVEAFVCPAAKPQAFLWDTDTPALALRGTPTGRKTYVFESRLNGATVRVAKRFDMLVLRTQLAVLQALPDFATLKQRMQAIASALEDQDSIPAIKAQIVLIQSVAGEEWWEDVTIAMLESARRKLRALVKLIEKGKKNIVYTDFADEMGEQTTVELPGVATGMNLAKFKDKARQFLREHEDHLSLQRLRRNQPLTKSDLVELERMLVEAGGSAEVIKLATEQNHGLGIFIRSLVSKRSCKSKA